MTAESAESAESGANLTSKLLCLIFDNSMGVQAEAADFEAAFFEAKPSPVQTIQT